MIHNNDMLCDQHRDWQVNHDEHTSFCDHDTLIRCIAYCVWESAMSCGDVHVQWSWFHHYHDHFLLGNAFGDATGKQLAKSLMDLHQITRLSISSEMKSVTSMCESNINRHSIH